MGCGAGDNASILMQRGATVDGITLSAEEAHVAAAVCRKVVVHDLEKGLPLDLADSYDCCLCSHVIEHLCWPGPLLADVNRLLSPSNGLLIVALPNFLFVKQRYKILRGDFYYERSGLWDETHFRWYTFVTARQLIESAGFEISHASATGYLPLGPIRKAVPKIAQILDLWVSRRWPGLFGWQFLYVARPKKGGGQTQ